MAIYYLDSSAVIKRYQAEQGSAEVHRIVNEPDSVRFISRLSILEVQRAFNRRLRTGEISEQERDFYTLTGRRKRC